jgi:hypothetical protein
LASVREERHTRVLGHCRNRARRIETYHLRHDCAIQNKQVGGATDTLLCDSNETFRGSSIRDLHRNDNPALSASAHCARHQGVFMGEELAHQHIPATA